MEACVHGAVFVCVHHQMTGLEGGCPANGRTGFCVLRQLLEKVVVLLVCFQRAGGKRLERGDPAGWLRSALPT